MNWPERYAEYREAFASAMDKRLYNIEYLDNLLNTGRAAIWFSANAALVCEIRRFPTGALACCVLVAAGDAREIVDELRPQAEQWGRHNGCMFGMIESREGWQKMLKPHGYAPFQVSLVKEL